MRRLRLWQAPGPHPIGSLPNPFLVLLGGLLSDQWGVNLNGARQEKGKASDLGIIGSKSALRPNLHPFRGIRPFCHTAARFVLLARRMRRSPSDGGTTATN